MNEYTFRVFWSEEYKEWVATVDQYPTLVWPAPSVGDALDGLCYLIDEMEIDDE